LRRPIESAQYTSSDYTQTLDDHRVLASVGSVGDAYDNALAESFVDSFKTELITDRAWSTRTQLELAVVEYVGWFNHDRLHESLRDLPPVEFEQTHAPNPPIPGNPHVAALQPRAADGLTEPRSSTPGAPESENGADRADVGPTPHHPVDEGAADGSLHSLYELAALTAGETDPSTIA